MSIHPPSLYTVGTAKVYGTASAPFPFVYAPPSVEYMLSLKNAGAVMSMASIPSYNMGADGKGSFTIAAWVKGAADASGWLITRFYGGLPAHAKGYGLGITRDGLVRYVLSDGESMSISQSTLKPQPVIDGSWHYVVWTRTTIGEGTAKTSEGALYIDGVKAPTFASDHKSIDISTEAPLLVGLSQGGYSGGIAFIQVWTRALGQAEIQANMHDHKANPGGLIGSWSFVGGTTNDQSSNANAGVLQSGAQVIPGGPKA